MRRTSSKSGFFICMLLNMLLNAEWCIPSVILLVLHFWLGWPLWPVFASLALWFIGILLWMLIIRKVSDCSYEEPHKPNKKPYSKKNSDIPHNK